MPRKIEVHYDFAVMIVISLALSGGFNLYQRHQYNELLMQHTALQWEAQDLEINQAMNLRKLAACNNPDPKQSARGTQVQPAGDQFQAAPASRSPLPLTR